MGKTGAAHWRRWERFIRSRPRTVATPRRCLPLLAALSPVLMTVGLPDDPAGTLDASGVDKLLEQEHDVIACGPGLGRTPQVAQFVRALLTRPLCLSSSMLTRSPCWPTILASSAGARTAVLIITPHPGEMARLAGLTIADVQAHRIMWPATLHPPHQVYVVLKGHRTGSPRPRAGVHQSHRQSGHGHGRHGRRADRDVRGVARSIARRRSGGQLAVFLHGLAGDLAEADQGQASNDRHRSPRSSWRRARSSLTKILRVPVAEHPHHTRKARRPPGQRPGPRVSWPGRVLLLEISERVKRVCAGHSGRTQARSRGGQQPDIMIVQSIEAGD